MRLIDTHVHLDLDAFADDRPQMLARCRARGVERLVIPGIQASGWSRLLALAHQQPGLYAALGLHPLLLEVHRPADLAQLEQQLRQGQADPVLCAIGEIGLDFLSARTPAGQAAQQQLLEAQLALAARFRLPVLLHVRRAHARMIATLKRHALPRRGIVHAFSGSLEEAREYLRLGYWLGLGGAGTWPQARRMHRVLQQLPPEALVLETDAPDMPPAGHAGERNSPELLPEICQNLARQRGIPASQLAESSYLAACRVFGWRPSEQHIAQRKSHIPEHGSP